MDTTDFMRRNRRYVLAAAEFLARRQGADGDFLVPDSRCEYNEFYDAKGAFTLLQAIYWTEDRTQRERLVDTLARRLELFEREQLPDGSLPLMRGAHHGWVAIAATAACVVKLWGEVTNNARFVPFARRCVDYVVGCFTADTGFRRAHNANELNTSDPFPLYSLHLWRDEMPEAAALVGPATEYVVGPELWDAEGRFWRAGVGIAKEKFDLATFPHPTLDLDRAWVLFEIYGTRYAEMICDSILAIVANLPAIESFYTEGATPYQDTRARTALAAVMATFDHHTQTSTFTDSALFGEMLDWSKAMFDEEVGAFCERVDATTGQRECYGVPAQYLSQYLFSCGLLTRA